MRRLKLGLVTDNYPDALGAPPSPSGGIGTYTKLVGEELARLGHEVHVFTFSAVPRHRRVEHNGLHVWQCPPWSKRRYMTPLQAAEFTFRYRKDALLLNAYSVAVAVRRATAGGRPFDVLEAPDVGVLGMLSRGRQYTRRYAVRLHATTTFGNAEGVTRRLTRLDEMQRQDALTADVLTAPTDYSRRGAEEFWGVSLPRAITVGNPVAIVCADGDDGPPSDADTAIFFGRLIFQKGVDLLAASVPLVRRTHPDYRVTFVGPDLNFLDGRRATDVIRRAAGPAAGDGVTVLPPMAHGELRPVARAHGLCVLPSREETFGLTFVEAMAWGLPCVVSDIPPFRELATDGEHCLFAAAEDVDALASQTSRLLSDRPLARKLARNAREHSRKWAVQPIVQELLKAWL